MKKVNNLIFLFLCTISFSAFSQSKPFANINLANAIYYSDTSFTDLPGNGFLIDIGDEILAVTCKHVLWTNRPKEMKTIDFKGKLKEWRMVSLNDPSQYVILGDLLNINSNESIGERNTDRDYLVFKVKENHSKIIPLKLSAKAVQPLDTIYTIGWSYQIKRLAPQSFKAIAKGYSGSSLFISSLIPHNGAGMSGSPVVNNDKELVAIVSSWKVDIASNKWYEAPCSTNYLLEVLYSNWLSKGKREKSVKSFQEFLSYYKSLNGFKPEISSYLYTELFFADWLKSKGLKYGSLDLFNQWAEGLLKANGIKVIADNYRKGLLVFDGWKNDYSNGSNDTKGLEQLLVNANGVIPDYINFCEYSQELSKTGKHDKAIALLLFADEKLQHMGQLYAYLGDAYLAKGDKALAKDSYLKCLKTYPEFPQATEGLEKLKELKGLTLN